MSPFVYCSSTKNRKSIPTSDILLYHGHWQVSSVIIQFASRHVLVKIISATTRLLATVIPSSGCERCARSHLGERQRDVCLALNYSFASMISFSTGTDENQCLPKGKCLIVMRHRVRNWASGNGQNTVPLKLMIMFCDSCGRRKPALSAVLYRNVSGYLNE